MHYLRAHGPDIVLRVEDVVAGVYGSSSSSSSLDSSDSEVQSSPPSVAFQVAERYPFQFMSANMVQRPLIILASLFVPPTPVEPSDPALAIIPYRPSAHAVMIEFWVKAQEK